MTTLTNLIERVEAADWGDLEIDKEISDVLVLPGMGRYKKFDGVWHINVRWTEEDEGGEPDWRIPAKWDEASFPHQYTDSVDSAILLVERLFPGYAWGVHVHKNGYRAHVTERTPFRPMPCFADHKTPALALCLALLKAKLSESPLASEGVSAAGESET